MPTTFAVIVLQLAMHSSSTVALFPIAPKLIPLLPRPVWKLSFLLPSPQPSTLKNCAVLLEIRYQQNGPNPLYEDKLSAINVINNRTPTERSRHMDIQHFAMQELVGC